MSSNIPDTASQSQETGVPITPRFLSREEREAAELERRKRVADQWGNPFIYPEFASFAGFDLLREIVRAIVPLALFRTWEAAVSFQPDKGLLYVGVERLAKVCKVSDRKIRMDVKEFEVRELLVRDWQWVYEPQKDGSTIEKYVRVWIFDRLYELAYEFYTLMQSTIYTTLPPCWDSKPGILADEKLVRYFRQFECYRRVIEHDRPGRKGEERTAPTYEELVKRFVPEVALEAKRKVFTKELVNTSSTYRVIEELNGNPPIYIDSRHKEEREGRADYTKMSDESEASNTEQVRVRFTYPELETSKIVTNEIKPAAPGSRAASKQAIIAQIMGGTAQQAELNAAFGLPAPQSGRGKGQQAAKPQRERRPVHPVLLQLVTQLAAALNDDPEIFESTITRAEKIATVASQCRDMSGQEFLELAHIAYKQTCNRRAAGAIKKRNPKNGQTNAMPFWFTCLLNLLKLDGDETRYLESEECLYADTSYQHYRHTMNQVYNMAAGIQRQSEEQRPHYRH